MRNTFDSVQTYTISTSADTDTSDVDDTVWFRFVWNVNKARNNIIIILTARGKKGRSI